MPALGVAGTKPVGLLWAMLLLAACAPGSTTDGGPPHIVLVTLDTTRADHLGTYGYFRDTSPELDAFALRSLVFERAIAPMAVTLPTHLSILTGTAPLEHGVMANLQHAGRYFEPSPHLRSFAELARGSGYRTAAFVSSVALARATGVDAGFEHFDEPAGAQRPADRTNARVFAWLDRMVFDRPLLLWVHYYDPHWPFQPPADLRGHYRTDEALEEYLAERRVPQRALRPNVSRFEEARSTTNLYDAEIRSMDRHFGALVRVLEERLGDRTAWLVIGDHGEGLGQHGEAAHGGIYGEQLWIPFFLRAPGLEPGRTSRLVSAVDALPTLLGRIGVGPFGAFLEQATGRDALAEDFSEAPLLSHDTGRKMGDPRWGWFRQSLTGPRWKYVRWQRIEERAASGEGDSGRRIDPETLEQLRSLGYVEEPAGTDDDWSPSERHELFDLEADPHELSDVSARHPGVMAELSAELERQVTAQTHRGRELQVEPATGTVD